MAIATAGLGDAEAMALIHAACFPPPEAWSADVFRLQLVLPNVLGLLDQADGLILLRRAANEAEVLTLAVLPARRRLGIAGRLLQHAIEQLSGASMCSLLLEVSVANDPARALYAATGFAAVGRRPHYYVDGTDALVLRLALKRAGHAAC